MLLQSLMLLVLVTSTCFAARPPQVVVGTTLPLNTEGRLIEIGLQAAFRQANEASGEEGRRFRLLAYDDSKQLPKAVRNIERLQQRTPFVLGLFTHGIVQAVLPKLQASELLVFGPDENSTVLYDQPTKNLVLTKPSLRSELDALVEHAVTKLGRRKFALFYADSTYGNQAVVDAKAALMQHNLTPIVEASYPDNTVEVHRAAAAMVQAQPDAIICLGRRHATYNFMLEVVNRGLIRTALLGTSYLLPIQRYIKAARGIDLIATSTVPNPWRSMQDVARSYRKAMRAYYPTEQFSTISLGAYRTASQFAKLAQGIGGEVTPAALMQAASMQRVPSTIWISDSFGLPWLQVRA